MQDQSFVATQDGLMIKRLKIEKCSRLEELDAGQEKNDDVISSQHLKKHCGSNWLDAREILCTLPYHEYMPVNTSTITIKSKGEGDMLDITGQVADAIKSSSIQNGIVTIFVSGSTAAVTTIEYEPGLKKDFPAMLDRVAPRDIEYEHDNTWHDGNGHSHVRASLIGPSLTVPFSNKRLMLGTWQQIVVVDMDNRPRERSVVLQAIGE